MKLGNGMKTGSAQKYLKIKGKDKIKRKSDFMPYIKTNWAEDTPITTALLNKIENGIESTAKEALPLTGGTLTGSITLPNSTKGQIKQTLTNGTATPTLYITTGDNLRVGSADISNVCIYSKTNPKTSVDGKSYTLYHEGNTNSPASGNWFSGGLARVGTDGVMEVGRYIDFHFNSDYIGGYQTRLEGKENGRLLINGHQAAMFENPNPKHHLIRYGKDLPGLDGFITFSL